MAKVILSSILVLLFLCSSGKRNTTIYVNVSNPYCIGCLTHLIEYLESNPRLAAKTKYLVNESEYSNFVILQNRLKKNFKVHSTIVSPASREIESDSIHFGRAKYSPEVIIRMGGNYIVFENKTCFDNDMLVSDTLRKTLLSLFLK
jgi:hypothetical protein